MSLLALAPAVAGTAQGVLGAVPCPILAAHLAFCSSAFLLLSLAVPGVGHHLPPSPGLGSPLAALRAAAAPDSPLQLSLWLLVLDLKFSARGTHSPLLGGTWCWGTAEPPRSCSCPSCAQTQRGLPGAPSRELGGFFFFCSLFVFLRRELSTELFTPLPISPANPSRVLSPLDDHGAVQSQPQEFHFYGEDL